MNHTVILGYLSNLYYQINCALTLNHTRSQWVDLGIQSEAYMTRPDTCGTAGGAISMWVNVVDVRVGGIISSYLTEKSGVGIYCTSQEIWYEKQHHVFTFHKYNQVHCKNVYKDVFENFPKIDMIIFGNMFCAS